LALLSFYELILLRIALCHSSKRDGHLFAETKNLPLVGTRVTAGETLKERKKYKMHIPVSKLFIWARLAAICINYVKLATELFSGPTSATPFAARARSNKRPFTAEPKTNFVSFFHCYTNFFSSCYTHTATTSNTETEMSDV